MLYGALLREGHAGRCRGPARSRHEGAVAARLRRSHRAPARDHAPGGAPRAAHADGRPPARRLSLRRAGLRGKAPVGHLAFLPAPRPCRGAGRRRLRPGALLRHGDLVRRRRSVGARRRARPHRAARPRRLSLARRLGELCAARRPSRPARHRPGQRPHAARARQRHAPPLPGRLLGRGGRAARRVPADAGRRGGAAHRQSRGVAHRRRGDHPGGSRLDSPGHHGGARRPARPRRALAARRADDGAGRGRGDHQREEAASSGPDGRRRDHGDGAALPVEPREPRHLHRGLRSPPRSRA